VPSSLIVIRIVPQSPIGADSSVPNAPAPPYFSSWLANSGGLTITAYDVSYNSPTTGQIVGTVKYVAPTAGPSGAVATPPLGYTPSLPTYAAGTGIVQQVDMQPPQVSGLITYSAYFEYQSVATAVIEFTPTSEPLFENLRLIATWGAGGATAIPITQDYYDVALAPGPAPNPATSATVTVGSTTNTVDAWSALAPSIYLTLPPPVTAGSTSFGLPADGTPPPFDSLLLAVKTVLGVDPGAVLPDLGKLSLAQCQNIAYELIWSQQPPLPAPPEPVESMYTNPPNTGQLTSGGGSTTPNQDEGNRQQFQASLLGYYAQPNAIADRLTNFVFSLSAAVACEEASLAATQVLLEFPADAATANSQEAEVVLTGVGGAGANFGVSAAYFYALAASMPTSMLWQQRYALATGENISQVLTELTTALNSNVVTDAETFTTAAGTLNAAQAARRLQALYVPSGSSVPSLALDATVQLIVTAWLEFAAGFTSPSTQTYQPIDETMPLTGAQPGFWPGVWGAQPAAYLELVLCALTQGYQVPAPVNQSLGSLITIQLLPPAPATVASLMAVTDAQWVTFFTTHPTYLPSGVVGNVAQQIANFIANLQRFFAVTAAGPASTVIYQTTVDANPADAHGGTVLTFASAAGVVPGMTVSGIGTLAPGSVVSGAPNAPTATTVTLSVPLTGDVPVGTNINFKSVYAAAGAGAGGLPLLQAPSMDWISAGLTAYGPFTFGSGFNLGNLQTAAGQVFPNDTCAQQWLVNALLAIDALYQVTVLSYPTTVDANPGDAFGGKQLTFASTSNVSSGMFVSGPNIAGGTTVSAAPTATTVALSSAVSGDVPVASKIGFTAFTAAMHFSVIEALFARGFTSAADVTALSSADFQTALTGTVAYPFAAFLFAAAQAISPNAPQASSPGTFEPINDGSLTNCIPAPCRSPFGPIEYLHEMLQVSPSGTCRNPLVAPAGQSTLSTVLAGRRGALGQLAASCANLDTALPMIDLVNECLEYMAAGVASTVSGTVYDTSAEEVASYELCQEGCKTDEDSKSQCHDPAQLLSALPEYSTPATPVVSTNPMQSNQSVEPAVYNILKSDFSACCLPYSQPLDVSRTYLRHLSGCRYEAMRTFRKCITEFALDPVNVPTGFQSYLWRYPVRIDIALEYLGITPEEYQSLFQGTMPQSCGPPRLDSQPPAVAVLTPAQVYGFAARSADSWSETAIQLPEFLRRTCLTYCEFLELWKSGYVEFTDGGTRDGKFPDCEPCCLENHWLEFPQPTSTNPNQPPTVGNGQTQAPGTTAAGVAATGVEAAQGVLSGLSTQQGLYVLGVFARLWHKLERVCGADYTFAQLCDICVVLELFNSSGLNPDFIRQLAAFQTLRDQFHLPLVDRDHKPALGAVGADRTAILALWVGESATSWPWAVRKLVEGVEWHARCQQHCEHRKPELTRILESNLDALSAVANFDPTSSTDTWHEVPTHTLRFAEVLAKIYGSRFELHEIFYLFTTGAHSEGGYLFPPQGDVAALEYPLNIPDDEHRHSLSRLRHKLLEVEVSDEDVSHWTWNRIETALREEFRYDAAAVLQFGRHFFPTTLQASGYLVDAQQRRFSSALAATQTTPGMWSTPASGPFQYDNTAGGALFMQLPLADVAVIGQLEKLQALNATEQNAVQDLYFQPRAELALFGFLLVDFAEAHEHLIQAGEEDERWRYFRRQFALCHRRCRILAEHLAAHVDGVTRQERPEGAGEAFEVLRHLSADENGEGNWENDSGQPPAIPWPGPNGGAFAALLGLLGTGLLREFTPAGGNVIWRDLSGPLNSFGRERDKMNCPLPTLVPSLGLTLTAAQLQNVAILNGIAAEAENGAWLGGAQGFSVSWAGVLLVDHEGAYDFSAGAPTTECERPDVGAIERCQWRLTLTRDGKTRVILNHNWPGQTGPTVPCPHLKSGAYDITVELVEPAPAFAHKHEPRVHTGFQVKYAGPDTHDRLVQIPHSRLFRAFKELKQADTKLNAAQALDLGYGITGLAPGAMDFLQSYYSSSLRDIRRTYQRAFKALLFAHRFGLSANRYIHGHREFDGHCELGFMLAHPTHFAGISYYRPGGGTNPFQAHMAQFDLNFLPLIDNYYAPTAAQDTRVSLSAQCSSALFDWWERIFDYDRVRARVRAADPDCHLWTLFDEAVEQNPTNPGDLLRRMGARRRNWPADLRYYQDQFNPPYSLTSADLGDDRWLVRVWHAEELARRLFEGSSDEDVSLARPDLWVSDDPSAPVAGSATGNSNLLSFLCDRCFDHDMPRRYEEIRKLNNELRERGRRALIAYLCAQDRVALPWNGESATASVDLSDLLLLDVDVGVCETASRIEEAITAVQSFVRRARLGLEPGWTVGGEFGLMWDRHFGSFQVWQACKRRHVYKENYIEWEELEKARRIEAFRLLESQLSRSALSLAHSGGLEWWPDERPPAHRGLDLLQNVEVDETRLLTQPRQGLNLLATAERAAQPSWLTVVTPSSTLQGGGQGGTGPGQGTQGTPSAGQGSQGNVGGVLAPAATTGGTTGGGAPTALPFWIEAAIRLGRRFIRIAAAGVPPASAAFECGCHDEVCCTECGRKHAARVDEYYFWLVDGGYYSHPLNSAQNGAGSGSNPDDYQYGYQDDFYSQSDQQSGWQDPTQLPQMLLWSPNPLARLAWCRVHNGEFQQPRISTRGVPVKPGTSPDITFLGRTADSLYFSVSNPLVPDPPPQLSDPSAPGFRFDMALDDAVVLPQVIAPPTSSTTYPGGLPCYPYFAYDQPGTHLLPLSFYSPAIAVGRALRAHCSFEAALKWYRLAYDPLNSDCTWMDCQTLDSNAPNPDAVAARAFTIWERHGRPVGEQTEDWYQARKQLTVEEGGNTSGACCDATRIGPGQARNRSVMLHWLEAMQEYGDALMRKNSPEHFQQARVVFDAMRRVLGKRPVSLEQGEPAVQQTVATFVPNFPPLNPRLLDLYDVTRDRLGLIHDCLNAKRLHNGRLHRDMPYFGNSPLREGWRTTVESCPDETDWCLLPSPYRFSFLMEKAQEYTSRARELGSQLLAAFEKGDAEYLAAVRANQESELAELQLAMKQDQWRDADWQVEALQKTKAISQANFAYYTQLIQTGLITDEIAYQDLTVASTVLRAAGDAMEGIASAVAIGPNTFSGGAGFGGSPLFYVQLPIGGPLSEVFSCAAKIMDGLAAIAGSTAGLELTEATWQRRLDEWNHQVRILTIEIEQVELQILGGQRRRNVALRELNIQQRQVERSREVANFLRDKFTAQDLYLFLQKETADLYYKVYDLALHWARQAQHAFNLERGFKARRFIPEQMWDSLQEGLLAGDRLDAGLRHMEKAYCDENVREYELTKYISLRQHQPMEYLRLRATGYCEIDIPEWLFDLDYPGMYLRQIVNVTATIPSVTGPFNNVNCRLTLLSSDTRIDPRLDPPAHRCCCDRRELSEYELCACDPRKVRQYTAQEAIATSSGKNDAGLFEINFRDERYLPFEYRGAASRWRVELPRENNYFDLDTVSDFILRVDYKAREGGEMLRRAANASARRHLPGDGWCFFDVRHDFPDAWELLRVEEDEKKRSRELALRLTRRMFPYVPEAPELLIDRMVLLFETEESAAEGIENEPHCCDVEECRCRECRPRDSYEIGLRLGADCSRDRRERDKTTARCVVGRGVLYEGCFDLADAPILGESVPRFEIPPETGTIRRIYLFCHYVRADRDEWCCGSRIDNVQHVRERGRR